MKNPYQTAINRRTFIKHAAIAAGSISIAGLPTSKGHALPSQNRATEKSRIVIVKNDQVRNGGKLVQASIVEQMLNNAMERYFEVENADKAWSVLFSSNDVVGIKINCLAGRGMSTSPQLVDAIAENLQRIGVKKDHIIVWDRANRDLEKAGFHVSTSSRQVKYYGNDQAGYSEKLYESGSIGSLLSNVVVKECTAIINVPILKDHGIVGVTNALKNFFGAIHNPNKYHSRCGDPFIADIHMIPELRSKIRLTVSDVLTSQYEGGPPFMPQWTWPYNGIMIGTDMVAMDTVGWQIIEKKRAEQGMPPLTDVGRKPTYIATAGDERHGLGNSDMSRIECINL
ncbi:DUF362 domain-containing protein [candidate division KSB1 bacterium]|nr:DUF362 domain-containing protein [candidate division KSB1 bacterium]